MIIATQDTLDKVPDNDDSVIFFRRHKPVVYRSHDPKWRLGWLKKLLKRKVEPTPYSNLEGRV